MVLTAKSFAKDAWGDLKDLKEVCPDCQAIAELGDNLYACHLYLAHLRGPDGLADQFDFTMT